MTLIAGLASLNLRLTQVGEHRVLKVMQFGTHLGAFDLPDAPHPGGGEADSSPETNFDDRKTVGYP